MDETFTPEVQDTPSFTAKLTKIFASSRMLVIAILYSASVAIALLLSGSFNILTILLTVAVWLLYAGAKKDTLNRSGLSIVNGVVMAESILSYVAAALLLVSGILIIVCSGFISADMTAEIETGIQESLGSATMSQFEALLEPYGVSLAEFFTEGFLSTLFIIFGGIMIFAAVLFAVFAILYTILRKFTKSLCLSADAGENKFIRFSFAKGFIMFFAIINAVSALCSLATITTAPASFFSAGLMSAAYFFLFFLLKKDFAEI